METSWDLKTDETRAKAPAMRALPATRRVARVGRWGAAALLVLGLGWASPLRASGGVPGEAGILRATLKNGLRVVIVENKLAPVVTTEVNYLVGSNEAPAGFPGMAHAQAHMMFRGSPGLSADQLADITAAMGGDFDADTQQTVTQYFFTVPADELDLALHIEALRMGGVLDSDELWGEERGAIEQEVAQDLSNPQYVFYTKLSVACGSTWPTITSTALLGAYQASWKRRSMAPVVLSKEGRVPRASWAYGVPLNIASRSLV